MPLLVSGINSLVLTVNLIPVPLSMTCLVLLVPVHLEHPHIIISSADSPFIWRYFLPHVFPFSMFLFPASRWQKFIVFFLFMTYWTPLVFIIGKHLLQLWQCSYPYYFQNTARGDFLPLLCNSIVSNLSTVCASANTVWPLVSGLRVGYKNWQINADCQSVLRTLAIIFPHNMHNAVIVSSSHFIITQLYRVPQMCSRNHSSTVLE